MVKLIKQNKGNIALVLIIIVFFHWTLSVNYLFFHIVIELFAIVIAFSLFTITWNARKEITNQFLLLIGLASFFIALLDTFHVVTYQGMNIIEGDGFYANQFWVITRFIESMALLIGFILLKYKININDSFALSILLLITALATLSILVWETFPVCYIEGEGQTKFKIIAEYIIMGILAIVLISLIKNRNLFDSYVLRLIILSVIFAIITEFSFTLYISNYGLSNQIGHYSKLVTFYLIYKANIETGFRLPTRSIFKELKSSEENYRILSEKYRLRGEELTAKNKDILEINNRINKNLEEIQNLNNQLAVSNKTLKSLNATKDKFFSIVAHDLKNPFSALLGFSELILRNYDKYDKEKVLFFINNIHQTSKQAFSLLENLLEWSRLQTGRLEPKTGNISIDEIIQEVVLLTKPMAQVKNINLDVIGSTERQIRVDASMIKTVLRNLVTNAIKFTDKHGEIIIICSEQEDKVNFEVKDNGIGIEEEHLSKIFNIDSKLSKKGTENEKGTGLGLILCKEFIEKHNGKIWVESVYGNGSSFNFTIPISEKTQ